MYYNYKTLQAFRFPQPPYRALITQKEIEMSTQKESAVNETIQNQTMRAIANEFFKNVKMVSSTPRSRDELMLFIGAYIGLETLYAGINGEVFPLQEELLDWLLVQPNKVLAELMKTTVKE